MKIAALLMAVAAVFFVWVAFQIQFLKRPPSLLKMYANIEEPNGHFSNFAIYYMACAVAAICFSALIYRARSDTTTIVAVPAICAVMVLWRKILIRRVKRAS